ncbi:MAG: proton-conducting transporter membrane subunit [Bdellovibrionota bacterium]
MNIEVLTEATAFSVIVVPLIFFALIAAYVALKQDHSEKVLIRTISFVMLTSFILSFLVGIYFVFSDAHRFVADFGTWYQLEDYKFNVSFIFDSLSIPMLILSNFLIGIVGHFSSRYLHKDDGFVRFFLLYLLFSSGMSLVIVGATLDLIMMGWELVGISSALLIGFYQKRTGPVNHGFKAFSYYRVCDLGLLLAAGFWHMAFESSNLSVLSELGGGIQYSAEIILVCVSVFIASLAKSAQLPMASWLPSAMEGPTPSSAIFYGALSIHAGAYLLMRMFPLIEGLPWLRVFIGFVGIATAVYGAFVGRSRNDIKTLLAYASLSQVGIIFFEISLGFNRLALVHLIGNSLLRSWQFLSSPSLLHDIHILKLPANTSSRFLSLLPHKMRYWIYRQSLMGGNLDSAIFKLIVTPVVKLANLVDGFDKRWLYFIDDETLEQSTRIDIPTSKETSDGIILNIRQ